MICFVFSFIFVNNLCAEIMDRNEVSQLDRGSVSPALPLFSPSLFLNYVSADHTSKVTELLTQNSACMSLHCCTPLLLILVLVLWDR